MTTAKNMMMARGAAAMYEIDNRRPNTNSDIPMQRRRESAVRMESRWSADSQRADLVTMVEYKECEGWSFDRPARMNEKERKDVRIRATKDMMIELKVERRRGRLWKRMKLSISVGRDVNKLNCELDGQQHRKKNELYFDVMF